MPRNGYGGRCRLALEYLGQTKDYYFSTKRLHDRTTVTEFNRIDYKEAGKVADKIISKVDYLDEESLTRVLELAFENAMSHGAIDNLSLVYWNWETDKLGVRIQILNSAPTRLPAKIRNKTFHSTEEPFSVAVSQGRKATTGQGLGTPEMTQALKQIYDPDLNTSQVATLSWKEVSQQDGKVLSRRIFFEVSIPAPEESALQYRAEAKKAEREKTKDLETQRLILSDADILIDSALFKTAMHSATTILNKITKNQDDWTPYFESLKAVERGGLRCRGAGPTLFSLFNNKELGSRYGFRERLAEALIKIGATTLEDSKPYVVIFKEALRANDRRKVLDLLPLLSASAPENSEIGTELTRAMGLRQWRNDAHYFKEVLSSISP